MIYLEFLRKKKTGCWMNNAFVGILGYADDLLLLSPTIDGLQSMFNTCEDYAKTHNLSFSTHANPTKCKTKCMAFVKDDRELRSITLDGKLLPWVESTKHLGCKLGSTICGLKDDLMEKIATFINKVNEFMQEFYFAHPLTKIRINNIFNSSFYGSPLWNLFGYEANRLEKSWNVSQRILFYFLFITS